MNENVEYRVTNDSSGNRLSGEKNYCLRLPPGIPICKFWSVIVYDNQTFQMIITDQRWPSVYSSCKKLLVNEDSSVDIWFGPTAPEGKEGNFIKTIPEKEWYMILRLYEQSVDHQADVLWMPGKMEEIK